MYEFGCMPNKYRKVFNVKENFKNICFSFGADITKYINDKTFLIYQGYFKHTHTLYDYANIILPVSTYVERSISYLNVEGRLRMAKKIISSYRLVLNDLEVLKGLFLSKKQYISHNFSILADFYNTLNYFKNLFNYGSAFMFNSSDILLRIKLLSGFFYNNYLTFCLSGFIPVFGVLFLNNHIHDCFFVNSLFNRVVNNYYFTDGYSKNSRIMSLSAIKLEVLNFSGKIFAK